MIRRILSCCLVLALSLLVMADVRAQSGGIDSPYPYRGQASEACLSWGASLGPEWTFQACNLLENRPTWGVYQGRACSTANGCNGVGTWAKDFYWAGPQCPNGQDWNNVTNKCDAPCNTKPPMTNVRFQVVGGSAGSTCSGGCEYAVDLTGGSGQTGLTTIGGVAWYRAASMSATGAYCTSGNVPISDSAPACATQGNLTQCVKPDGQHCATASSGKQFCWQPGENGIKASGNDAATKSPDGTTPKPPPLPPNNGGEWTQTGQSTVTTTINNTTQTSNVTGWQSNYGSQGSGASGNGASGEGNSGNGSGSGLGGNGSGNGSGDGDDDEDGPSAPGAGVDDLYTPSDKTIEGVFSAFKARVGQAPMMDAIDSFFTVSASGSCPTWTVPASTYNEAMTLDWHCSGNVLTALVAIGWVIMAVAAFFAAMWALS